MFGLRFLFGRSSAGKKAATAAPPPPALDEPLSPTAAVFDGSRNPAGNAQRDHLRHLREDKARDAQRRTDAAMRLPSTAHDDWASSPLNPVSPIGLLTSPLSPLSGHTSAPACDTNHSHSSHHHDSGSSSPSYDSGASCSYDSGGSSSFDSGGSW